MLKRELLGATTIKRARLDDQQLVVFNEDDMVDVAVSDGVYIRFGVGFGVQSVGATSCSRCCGFLCEKYKKHDEDSIMYLQTLSQAVNEFKNKRGSWSFHQRMFGIHTLHRPRGEKKSFIKAIQNLKKKTFGELPMAVGEKLMEFKHVNLYRHVPIAQKNKLVELMRGKDLRVQYDMEFFSGDDFSTMTSTNIWWEDWYNDEILSLMRERNLRSPEYYDSTNRILNLNFYTNLKKSMTVLVRRQQQFVA
ncbi:hypothetical protein KY285_001010 [Solanum tuberosum]|nr:hypothetical protein KY285_001010 [Solanum tuberosum]